MTRFVQRFRPTFEDKDSQTDLESNSAPANEPQTVKQAMPTTTHKNLSNRSEEHCHNDETEGSL